MSAWDAGVSLQPPRHQPSPLVPSPCPRPLRLGVCVYLVCLLFLHLVSICISLYQQRSQTHLQGLCQRRVESRHENPTLRLPEVSGHSDLAHVCGSSLPKRSATPQSHGRNVALVCLVCFLCRSSQQCRSLTSVERSRACTRVSPGVALPARAARVYDLSRLLSCVYLLPH